MEPRTYRHWIESRELVPFNVTIKETDLYIRAGINLRSKASRLVLKYRRHIEKYIEQHPAFLTSLEPLTVPASAPKIVIEMIEASAKAGVGPMSSVAGAIAEYVGKDLLEFSREIIIENGGDIYMKSLKKRTVGIFAGESPLTGKVGLEVSARETPIGIGTSSGTVGPSLSYGNSDAVVVLSPSAILADAAATAIGNHVKKIDDINSAIEFGKTISGLKGVVIIMGDNIGVWGDIKLCQTSV